MTKIQTKQCLHYNQNKEGLTFENFETYDKGEKFYYF